MIGKPTCCLFLSKRVCAFGYFCYSKVSEPHFQELHFFFFLVKAIYAFFAGIYFHETMSHGGNYVVLYMHI